MTETAGRALDEDVAALALTDHHVHPALAAGLAPHEFEGLLTESDRPVPPWHDPVRLPARDGGPPLVRARTGPGAVRRARGLPGPAGRRWAPAEVTRRLLRASGIGHYLIDTGYLADGMLDLAGMAEASGAATDEIVRLESVAEQVLLAGDATAAGFAGLAGRGAGRAGPRRGRPQEHRRLPARARLRPGAARPRSR